MGGGVARSPALPVSRTFKPAASVTAKNPALTSWAKEYRAVGLGAARFAQSLGKLPDERLSRQAFGIARGPANKPFLPAQNVEESLLLTFEGHSLATGNGDEVRNRGVGISRRPCGVVTVLCDRFVKRHEIDSDR